MGKFLKVLINGINIDPLEAYYDEGVGTKLYFFFPNSYGLGPILLRIFFSPELHKALPLLYAEFLCVLGSGLDFVLCVIHCSLFASMVVLVIMSYIW